MKSVLIVYIFKSLGKLLYITFFYKKRGISNIKKFNR